MALETASNPTTPSAQVVGNAFVEQYYHILHTSPDMVFRFYQDSSMLSRPDANGAMTSVTTMQGINEKMLSLNFKDYKAEIKTADAQKSHMEGVTVLVTGCLTGKDNLKRKFAQSFFLAPQDNGYFVLNDVFRFIDDNEPADSGTVNGIDNTQTVPSIPDPERSHAPDPSAPDPATSIEVEKNVEEKVIDPLEPEKQFPNESEAVVEFQSHSDGNEVSVINESASSAAQEDAPKKSYASIVKVAKGSSGPTKVYVPTNTSKMTAKKIENNSTASASPVLEPEAPVTNSGDVPENIDIQDEVEGYSIYIKNMPHNVTVDQLEALFKNFGPIKHHGIQVRFNKQQGYCFGFVEFLSSSSMNNALQASPVIIGGRQAFIEIKRTTTRVGSGRGRFPSSRAGFRSDIFRGWGNYGSGRGFGRNEFGGWGEFSARGRSSSGRGEGYQPGRGRGSRSSGSKQNANYS